ncbi:aldo/keto reductase [Streptomyces sp. NPDC005820]|uniref:aldo/keto reductase n=1 Tax=Streptomyces sp. NPDC005820 TaxID=3157069 RepID=UPI0033E705C5
MPRSPLDHLLDELPDREAAGTAVRRFILGGPFGGEPFETSAQRLTHFADAGGLLVETSRSYARGRAEGAVGQWLRKNPGALGVVTKVGHDLTGEDIPLSPALVRENVHASLESLGVDVIDVLLFHCDDPSRPVAELADTLVELVAVGYARRIGVSNWPAERLSALAHHLAERGQTPVASYQFSLAEPDPALMNGNVHAGADVLRVVRDHGLPLLSWSSQARGFFARTGTRQNDGRPDAFDTAENRLRRRRCRELADRLGSRPETVALAWTLHHSGVWPSIGPKTTEQLDRSLDALSLSLTDERVRWLREL